jgi:hypothetical protein
MMCTLIADHTTLYMQVDHFPEVRIAAMLFHSRIAYLSGLSVEPRD